MSFLFSRGRSSDAVRDTGDSLSNLVPSRLTNSRGTSSVPASQALRHSAFFAALRVRSNLMSSMPVDQFTGSGGNQREVSKSQLLTTPGALFVGGARVPIAQWLASSQVDLDRYGNCFGLVVERDALQRPTRVDLVDAGTVIVRVRGGLLSYVVGGVKRDASEVWHEQQFTLPGSPVGLSPMYWAAWSMNQYLTAQEFAALWFSSGGVPSAIMKNTKRVLTDAQAASMKARVREVMAAGDVLTVGADWDYSMVAVPANQTSFIEAQQFSVADVCRFLDVPADLIGAMVSGSSVTYANITQRMLQFLVVHFGPAVKRREDALTAALPSPQFAKLNTDAILRLDPIQRAAMFTQQLASKQRTPSEVRALDNLPPFTPEQEDEIARLLGRPSQLPQKQEQTS